MAKEIILILGASNDQVFAIRTAQAMGLYVLVVDVNPDSPGFLIADKSELVSTRDIPKLLELMDSYLLQGRKISGVLVQGSDIPQVGCEIANHVGSPCIPMEAALISIDKFKMKCRFQERGVPIPWFTMVESVEHLEKIVGERGFPLIIKPVDRSGARGVFYLSKGCDLEVLYLQSKALSYCNEVMVEEFMAGLQISTETIMYQSKAYTPGFADRNYEKLTEYAPNIIENGGWMPSSLIPEQRCLVERLVEQAALALGVTDGIVKGDVVMTEEGPKMIEMATRLSGGDFCESLIPLNCGVNTVEAAINIAVGRQPNLEKLKPVFIQTVANRYFFPSPGKLMSIEGQEIVEKQAWVKKLEFWYQPGDMLPKITSHADRFGVFVVVGENLAELESRIQWVYQTIKINIDSDYEDE